MKNVRPWVGVSLIVSLIAASGQARAQSSDDCDQQQLDTLSSALLVAGFKFIGAGNDIANIRQGGDTSRFEYWFGPASDDRVNHVEEILMQAYYGPLADATYVCTPTLFCLDPTIAAWVDHGSKVHTVHLCPVYFTSSFDEVQVGTLVHEFTHFYNTRDLEANEVNGATNADVAHNFATANPDGAIDAAINYEYYVTDIGRP
jgi:hypothetical protein